MRKLILLSAAVLITVGSLVGVTPQAHAEGGQIAAGVAGGLLGGLLLGGRLPGSPPMLTRRRFIMRRQYTSMNLFVGSSANNTGTAMAIESVVFRYVTEITAAGQSSAPVEMRPAW